MVDKSLEALAKLLPVKQVYDDAISPAAKQVGETLEDVIKTLRLALVPIQLTAAYQDRVARFIKKSVANVPEDRRVSPPSQILGPVIEGIRYEPEDTPIDEMFSVLLSQSMDQENLDKAHPWFPQVIRQLTADEARILFHLKNKSFTQIGSQELNPDARQNPEAPAWINPKIEKELDFPLEVLALPHKFWLYSEHLFHLGLSCFAQTRRQEPIYDPSGAQSGTREFREFRLMPLGRAFVDACIRDNP